MTTISIVQAFGEITMEQSTDRFISPPPPPPPPPQPISLRHILDEYYEGGSFGSSSTTSDAINAADMVLAEIDKISPSRDESKEGADPNSLLFTNHQVAEEDSETRELSKNESMESIRSRLEEMIVSGDEIPSSDPMSSITECVLPSPNYQIGVCSTSSGTVPTTLGSHMSKCHLHLEGSNESNLDQHAVASNTTRAVPQDVQDRNRIENSGCLPETLVSGSDAQSTINKKPFLRRGTRKEPSAVHRFNKANQANTNKSLVSTKERASKELEHLERMQEQQRENLQKRIERRQRAREEIHRNTTKGGCKIQVIDQDQVKEHVVQHFTIKNDEEEEVSTSDTSSDEASSVSDSFVEESDDSGECEEGATSRQTTSCKRPMKSNKHARSSLKPINKLKGSSKQKTSKDFQTPEMEEQWQVIKSMRRRQESALRAAEKDREEVKSWAASEREKLMKWKDNQRTLIQKEKQRTANCAMVSKRKKRKEKLEEQAAEEARFSHKRTREEIDSLKAALHKQTLDADAVKSRHRLSEKRWKDMISDRNNKIIELQDDLESMVSKNQKVKDEKGELSRRLESEIAERKKLEKKMEKRQQRSARKQKPITSNGDGNTELTCSIDHPAEDENKGNEPNTQDGGNTEPDHSVHSTVTGSEAVCACPSPPVTHQDDVVLAEKVYRDHKQQDEDATNIISSNKDLIEEPKENWLRCTLSDKKLQIPTQAQKIQTGFQTTNTISNLPTSLSFNTPMKGKPYNPSDYSSEPHTHDIPVQNHEYNFGGAMDNLQEKILGNAQRIITFQNGTTKETLPDGTTIVRFTNGDIKTSYTNIGTIVYYYAEAKTSHTTHNDGREIFEFASGQTERHYPDGGKEVHFPDGTKQNFLGQGRGENHTVHADGVQMVETRGHKRILNF